MKKNIEKFLERYRPVKVKRNELILQPGDFLDFAHFVKSGYVRIYSICKNGQEVTIDILKSPSVLPLFFTPNRIKSRYYVEAMTAAEVYQIPRKEMIDFLTNNTEFLPELMDDFTQIFRELLGRIEYLASGNAYTKVVSVLLSLSENSGQKKGSDISLSLAATHRIIASLTGLTRETVTLQMLKLKKKGFIAGKGRRLVITDLAKLKEERSCPSEENL